MPVSRALLVLGMLVLIGIAVVALRSESAKSAYRIQRLHREQLVLQQDLWAQEMALAKLRGPDEIRRRADRLRLEVRPPVGVEVQSGR